MQLKSIFSYVVLFFIVISLKIHAQTTYDSNLSN